MSSELCYSQFVRSGRRWTAELTCNFWSRLMFLKMAEQRFTAEEIIHRLREADVLPGHGEMVGEVCKQLGVSDKTYYQWRKSHGGLRIEMTYVSASEAAPDTKG